MSKEQHIDNIKREMLSIERYVYSYDNVRLPSGRKSVIQINTFQNKLGLLINTCSDMLVEYPNIFPVTAYNELINIKNEDISHARFEILDEESEYNKITNIWSEIKRILDPIVNL